MGESLPLACQDWANTKTAYRFFGHDRVSEAEILAGHFQSTCSRFADIAGPVLVLQDTTEFSYQRKRAGRVAATCRSTAGRTRWAAPGCTRSVGC